MNGKSSMPQKPCTITTEELEQKLRHLAEVLLDAGEHAILLNSEGAMRWLTGIKHQLGDIAPGAVSPVYALVRVVGGDSYNISIIAKPFEMPRLRDQIPDVFSLLADIAYDFLESMPDLAGVLSPADHVYEEIVGRIVRPLLGGFTGNQYAKVHWLSNMTMRVLAETAGQFTVGMNGMEARGLLLQNLARCEIDANLVLIALTGQECHLHPVASSKYKIEKGTWLKLVVGSRYAEQIVSQSLMVKLGGNASEREQRVYHALQDVAVECAACYRPEKTQREIYSQMLKAFRNVERQYNLKGFAASATLHHPGGGTSPLGNRDRMLDPQSEKTFEPWAQFAINPVDSLLGFKVELQGIVAEAGQNPFLLKMSEFTGDILNFRPVKASDGTTGALPELLVIKD